LSQDFYQLAQLSHFVAPGAARIGSNNFVSYNLNSSFQTAASPGLDDVACENLDGSKVLLAYNNSAQPITFAVRWNGSTVTDTIPPRATTTFDWR
jgi:glucosylceramidase